ncbi:MAG: GntR family transcriptional regulator [Hyphomicrobiales bacterium]|nr:GntR family transcriptional regulator [Hyphomicrobiales bacterium]
MTKRIADRLCSVLEEEIVTGVMAPGARLDELSLSERFKVSRTPIREALHQLSTSGLIELRPRRGAIVARIGTETLLEMFETMAEIEAACGRLAARRMTDGERRAFVVLHEACGSAAEQGDPDAYYETNAAFHEAIYRGCHNAFLANEARRLRRRLQAYRRLQLRARGRVASSFTEHREIVEAILAADEKTAETALRAHITVQGERFGDLLASLNALRYTGS